MYGQWQSEAEPQPAVTAATDAVRHGSPHPTVDAFPELDDEHIVRLARSGELVYRANHPLALAFAAAIEQATKGKGERHGGDSIPFYDQQWVTLARCHGVGFLTGQAAKKANEAAQKSDPADWEREVLGTLVYAGMAVLFRRGLPE